MTKFLNDNIRKRRSIRSFESKEISNEVVQELLISAMHAPSPKNSQPWKFIVCRGDLKKSISEVLLNKVSQQQQKEKCHLMALETAEVIATAPVIILICYERTCQTNKNNDGILWELNCRQNECCDILSIGASVQNILLEANNLGISSLWIADILYAYDEIKTLVECEDTIVSAVALGYSNAQVKMPKREFNKIFWLQ